MITHDGKILIAYEILFDGDPAGYPIHKEKKEIKSYVADLQTRSNIKISYRLWKD